jgi:enterochelin esterase-like enzyme
MHRLKTLAQVGFLAALLAAPAFAAEKSSAPQLIELAKSNSPALHDAITTTFDAKDLKEGTAWIGRGPDFFFATEASSQPALVIDGAPSAAKMQNIPSSNLWYATARIEPVARLHAFNYLIQGAKFGGRLDLPVYGPLTYLLPGVPTGTLSPKLEHTSKIYDGMKSDYWIYVPAQYDPKIPAALLVIQDGHSFIDRDGGIPVLNAIDNLIAQKKIPVMICVLIRPGDIESAPGTPTYNFVKAFSEKRNRTMRDSMRSTLYDTVSNRYVTFLRDEVLAEVSAKYNIRKDAYSRAIMGSSSGAICSFNAAWQMPDQFSRVITWIGSFTALQWHEDPANPDGGQDYPEKVLREEHRNIRVWLQDGSEDQENSRAGSWPLANIRLANALKLKEYDFHLSFGKGTHNTGQGAAEFPEELIWLWRDYDSSKTIQLYEIDAAEKSKPPFRVTITNRDQQ